MPVTYFAHQAPLYAVKRRWPQAVDGVALAVGSMTPDWHMAFSFADWGYSHSLRGLLFWCLPVGWLAARLFRAFTIPVVAASVPDGGRLRLKSWGVVSARRPRWWVTATSVAVGALSHQAWDALTHPGTDTARALSLNSYCCTVGTSVFSYAALAQELSHVVGTLGALAFIWRLGTRREFEQWYGEVAVARARRRTLNGFAKAMVFVVPSVAVAWMWADGVGWQRLFSAPLAGLVALSAVAVVVRAQVSGGAAQDNMRLSRATSPM